MSDLKDMFVNPRLRVGGYFELAIQVSESVDNEVVRKYKKHLWDLLYIDGPYDREMSPKDVEPDGYCEEGIVHLYGRSIPFITYYIKEESPVESGYNWFDVSFFTEAIDFVFGATNSDWPSRPSPPEEIRVFFKELMEAFYSIHPFRLAFCDFEISGQYYLHDLKAPNLQNWTNTHFYVPASESKDILPQYHGMVTFIE
ncbi:MAG: hypothetical protein EOP04_14330 [Proteobacteria bacterium]|nr:MAG: hypothetical protein EOP04_14330 [Pseudomonadota bacterium]